MDHTYSKCGNDYYVNSSNLKLNCMTSEVDSNQNGELQTKSRILSQIHQKQMSTHSILKHTTFEAKDKNNSFCKQNLGLVENKSNDVILSRQRTADVVRTNNISQLEKKSNYRPLRPIKPKPPPSLKKEMVTNNKSFVTIRPKLKTPFHSNFIINQSKISPIQQYVTVLQQKKSLLTEPKSVNSNVIIYESKPQQQLTESQQNIPIVQQLRQSETDRRIPQIDLAPNQENLNNIHQKESFLSQQKSIVDNSQIVTKISAINKQTFDEKVNLAKQDNSLLSCRTEKNSKKVFPIALQRSNDFPSIKLLDKSIENEDETLILGL